VAALTQQNIHRRTYLDVSGFPFHLYSHSEITVSAKSISKDYSHLHVGEQGLTSMNGKGNCSRSFQWDGLIKYPQHLSTTTLHKGNCQPLINASSFALFHATYMG